MTTKIIKLKKKESKDSRILRQRKWAFVNEMRKGLVFCPMSQKIKIW